MHTFVIVDKKMTSPFWGDTGSLKWQIVNRSRRFNHDDCCFFCLFNTGRTLEFYTHAGSGTPGFQFARRKWHSKWGVRQFWQDCLRSTVVRRQIQTKINRNPDKVCMLCVVHFFDWCPHSQWLKMQLPVLHPCFFALASLVILPMVNISFGLKTKKIFMIHISCFSVEMDLGKPYTNMKLKGSDNR